jgi:hypothetical protein
MTTIGPITDHFTYLCPTFSDLDPLEKSCGEHQIALPMPKID